MKVRIDHVVDIPDGFWCKRCYALTHTDPKKTDGEWSCVCGYFNRFVFMHGGQYLKCQECVDACYNAHCQKQ